jgi:hypothetical protein
LGKVLDDVSGGVLGVDGGGVCEAIPDMDAPTTTVLAEVGWVDSVSTCEPVSSVEIIPGEGRSGGRRFSHEGFSKGKFPRRGIIPIRSIVLVRSSSEFFERWTGYGR